MSYHSANNDNGQKYTGLSSAVDMDAEEMIFVSCWLKNDTSGAEHTIAEVFNNDGSEARATFRQLKAKGGNNDRLLLEFRDGAAGTMSTTTDGAFTSWTFAAVCCYHFTDVVLSPEQRLRTYINNDSVQTGSNSGTDPQNGLLDEFEIGHKHPDNGTNTDELDGKIAQFAIFKATSTSSSLLKDAEFANTADTLRDRLYNGGNGCTPNTIDLTNWDDANITVTLIAYLPLYDDFNLDAGSATLGTGSDAGGGVFDTTDTVDIHSCIRQTLNMALNVTADLQDGGGSGDISSTLPLAMDVTPALKATGNLSQSLPIVISLIEDLQGQGRLAASASMAIALTAAVTGTGNLSQSLPLAVDVTPDLKGSGAVSQSLPVAVDVTPALTGGGALSQTLALALDVAADLKATGVLAQTLSMVLAVVGAITGSGALSQSLPVAVDVTPDLKGSGAVSQSLPVAVDVTADLTDLGSGDISSTLPLAMDVTPALKGTGNLSQSLPVAVTVTPDLKATGVLSQSLPLAVDVTPALTGSGALTALLNIALDVVPDLKANGALAVALAQAMDINAALTGDGNLSSLQDISLDVASILTGTGNLSQTLPIALGVTPDLTGAGALVKTLTMALDVAADLKASGNLAQALAIVFAVSADLTDAGSGALSSTLPLAMDVTPALTGSGALSLTAPLSLTVTAALQGIGAPVTPDKLADPSITKAIRGREKRRLYKDRWNQFAETLDAFLRRQEPVIREAVVEAPTVAEALDEIKRDARFSADLEAVAQEITTPAEPIDAQTLLAELRGELAQLAKEIRDEEDVIAIIALMAADDTIWN